MEKLIIPVLVLSVLNTIILLIIICKLNYRKIDKLIKKADENDKNLYRLEEAFKGEFVRNREDYDRNSRISREELSNSMRLFQDSLMKRMIDIANLQKNQLDLFRAQIENLSRTNSESLKSMTNTIEIKLKEIQEDNSIKLEKMRETVDEKLHKTLEQRLGESFNLVSQRLEMVQRGLGEMQSLAQGVGDLKKVLSNVKTRGTLGEIQLEAILEQILSVEQYSKNVITKKDSRDFVEFAIKLPGKDKEDAVYLPVDSKFPIENYYILQDAYEKGNQSLIDEAIKLIENNIKRCARDIHDKYIDPPNTTDFGIMFLPIEGLYAEVVRRTNLIEILQREYKIIITGPTTLAALLNSLQMGFRTLAIEKHSSEVWKTLGAVKTEFEKFGTVLGRAQDRINQASEEIDNLVGVRTRQIQRKLKNVQFIASDETFKYIEDENSEG